MEIRSLGFRTDVMLLALGGSEVTARGTHLVVRTPANPGFWWGNFVLFDGPPAERDAARWRALFAAEFPAAGHRAFGVDGTVGAAGDPAAHRALGVVPEVSVVLTAGRLVPAAVGPAAGPAAEVRALDGDADWAAALRLQRDVYGEPESENEQLFLARQVAGHRQLCEAGHGRWFGAFVDGELRSGAGVFTDGGGTARYQNVHTHPDFRRRGLASAVLRRAAGHALGDPRTRTLVIVADPAGEAIGLYRSLGFRERESQLRLQGAGPAD